MDKVEKKGIKTKLQVDKQVYDRLYTWLPRTTKTATPSYIMDTGHLEIKSSN